jgi:hypothetical protein
VDAFAGVVGQSAAFTIAVGDSYEKVGAFVVSDAGRLYRVVVDPVLNTVVWDDLGGQQLRPWVTVVPSFNGVVPQTAFVIGGDGNLYARYWDGNAWQWSYQGNPGVTLSGNLSAVGDTSDWAVFAVGDNDRLYVDQNGQWVDLDGQQLTHYVSAGLSNEDWQASAFIVGGDGNLYGKHWNGSAWHWFFAGNPGVPVVFPAIAPPTVVKQPDIVSVVGTNGGLYTWSSDGHWIDLGGTQLSKPPATALRIDSDPMSNIDYDPRVFIVGGNGKLYANHQRDGSPWSWWSPGGCGLAPFISATSARTASPGLHYMSWVFVIGGGNRFYVVKGDYDHDCGLWEGYDLSAYSGAP